MLSGINGIWDRDIERTGIVFVYVCVRIKRRGIDIDPIEVKEGHSLNGLVTKRKGKRR